MKKIPIIVATLLAVTSLSLGQTRYDGRSKQGVSIEQITTRTEGESGRQLAAINVAENISQCSLTFITESLPDFPLGVPANFTIEACCGTPPYHFELVQGTLPEGLHLNKNGKINGKPREEADTTIFVKVTDNAGCSLTQAFQVRVVSS